MYPDLSSLRIGRARGWVQTLAALCALDVQIVVEGLGNIGRDLLLHFFIVAKRIQALNGIGNGDSPRQPQNMPKLPCDKRHC